MADYSMKQFLLNGGQFPKEGGRQRSNSTTNAEIARELTSKHQLGEGGGDVGGDLSSTTDPNRPRRMSCSSLTVRRPSIASSIGSYDNSTIREMEKNGELSHDGDDNGRGKILLSFHYSRDAQTLTLKVIQAKELRCGHNGEVCAFVTISFLPTSSASRLETKVRMLTSNPVWKEVFLIRNFLEEDFREHKAFVFEVWDKTSSGTSQLIGEAVNLLRSFPMDDLLEKGVVLWKYLSMDRQESELSLGLLTFYVRQCRRKKRLTVKIEKVNNAAIPASATQPSLYMKVQLLRDENKVLSERTKTVSNSYNPVFNHKMHISLLSASMQNASLRLVLKQQAKVRRDSQPNGQQHFQKAIGVVHLSAYAEREDLRQTWQRILACKDEKIHLRVKFSAPNRPSVEK